MEEYTKESTNPSWFGTTVGRVGGRIRDGEFSLPGSERQHTVSKNNGVNCCHGGHLGLSRVLWDSQVLLPTDDAVAVLFKHTSPDGADGFPGTLMHDWYVEC